MTVCKFYYQLDQCWVLWKTRTYRIEI